VPSPTSWLKRIVLGRPFRSDRLGETLLSKRLALPIFASDPLSSVAFATQEILLVLTLGGLAYLYLTPWVGLGVVVLLSVVIESPYREITRPVVDHVKRLRRESPRDVVAVYIPEYVVGRWWEQLLHNQSALRLKARLLFVSGVMVINVLWQLRSSGVPGEMHRGLVSTREESAVRRP
jgi:hypothetical protein